MTGERRVVHSQFVEVDRHVRHRLARVEHDERTDGACSSHQFLDGRDRAGHVGLVGERNDLHRVRQLQRIKIDPAVVGDAVPLERRTGSARKFLPGNEVGVVFEFGDDDFVARTDMAVEAIVTENVGHQIESLGGVLGEHQLVRIRTHEGSDGGASILVRVSRLFCELMSTPVYCRVTRGQEVPFGIENLDRTL